MNNPRPVRHGWPRPAFWPVWVVPAFVAVFQVVGSFGAQKGADDPPHDYSYLPLDKFAVALLLLGPVVLLGRRRYPVATLLAAGAITCLFFLRAYVYGPAFLTSVVAIVGVVTAGYRRLAWAGTLVGFLAYWGLTTMIGVDMERRGKGGALFPVERPTLGTAAVLVAWTIVVLAGAELVRMRSEKATEKARTLEEEERRQASEERLLMARELHDVLAHNISMINVQAGVALHLMDEQPEQARTALAAIKEASKEVLTEMRSVIGLLRQQDEAAPRSPTAGLARLEELLARARSAGLQVQAEIDGEARPLPAGVDLAAFRIVQESLTNVTRHAGGGAVTARVRISYGEREVAVRVDDDGRGVSLVDDHPGGSGIRGMRERAVALGGEFAAGPRPGGGFGVHATLPVEEAHPEDRATADEESDR